MTGKLFSEQNKFFVLRNEKYIVDNLEFMNKTIRNRMEKKEDVWVEFDILNSDVCKINKVYDSSFGTGREAAFIVLERHEKNTYPVNDFYPGYETHICEKCNNYFVGGSFSKMCELCALNLLIENNYLKKNLEKSIEEYSKLIKATTIRGYSGQLKEKISEVVNKMKKFKNLLK
jgi:hypothetical protein